MRLYGLVLLVTLPLIMGASSNKSKSSKSKQTGIYHRVEIMKDDEAEVIYNSEELEELFKRRGLVYQDEAVNQWVSGIGRSIAPDSTDPYIDYRFFVLRDPSPNAFALPNGQIYIHTGMLARLHNEAQLACLLGHEVIHVAGHHGILVHRSNKKKATAGAVFGGIFGVVGAAGGWTGVAGNVAAGITSVSVVSAMLGYSRELESEADDRGFEAVLATDYDVGECSGLFEELNRDLDGLQPPVNAKWSTHPDLQDRADNLLNKAVALSDYDPQQRVVGEDRFKQMTHDVALFTVEDYLDARYPATAVHLARGLTQRFPEDPQAWYVLAQAYYELGPESADEKQETLTKKQKTKRLRERSKHTRRELRAKQIETEVGKQNLGNNLNAAIVAYEKALELEPSFYDAHLGIANSHYDLGRDQSSAKSYIKFLKLMPHTSEKRFVMDRLKTLKARLTKSKGASNAG